MDGNIAVEDERVQTEALDKQPLEKLLNSCIAIWTENSVAEKNSVAKKFCYKAILSEIEQARSPSAFEEQVRLNSALNSARKAKRGEPPGKRSGDRSKQPIQTADSTRQFTERYDRPVRN